jgi:uncharacterized membrane protein
MNAASTETQASGLGTMRLEAFSDGVLAIVITLLALDFLDEKEQLVALKTATNGEVLAAMFDLWPHVLGYILSFVLIGVYWITHHVMFHQIRCTNRTLLWLNIAFLMSVAFIPFPTDLLAECADHQSNLMVAFYGMSHFLVSVSLFWLWFYAAHIANLVQPHLTSECRHRLTIVSLAAPALYLLGAAISFISMPLSFVVYLLVPALYIAPGLLDRVWPKLGHFSLLQHSRGRSTTSGSAPVGLTTNSFTP